MLAHVAAERGARRLRLRGGLHRGLQVGANLGPDRRGVGEIVVVATGVQPGREIEQRLVGFERDGRAGSLGLPRTAAGGRLLRRGLAHLPVA